MLLNQLHSQLHSILMSRTTSAGELSSASQSMPVPTLQCAPGPVGLRDVYRCRTQVKDRWIGGDASGDERQRAR
jgi:hypothetical protein